MFKNSCSLSWITLIKSSFTSNMDSRIDSCQVLISLGQKTANGGNAGTADAVSHDVDDIDDTWMVVGKKNKVSVQRTTGRGETSILSAIFGGYVQSEVKATGSVSSITTHAFTTLILDIVPDCVLTIEDALDLYTAGDSVPGAQNYTDDISHNCG